jgi:regulation of enolase protein 1 (concanavalin A-like superfamily)
VSGEPIPPPLPADWDDADIGHVGAQGSALYEGGGYQVAASGADIWGTLDEFHFVFRSWSGDGAIVAHVAAVSNTDPWTKAGVMVRDGLTAGAAHAFMIQTPTTIKGTAFQRRAVANAATTSGAGPAVAPPYWVRLARSGNTFTASVSPNGTTWTVVGADTIAMGATVDVGLAVSSHVAASLATATFDNVTITPSP